MLKYDIAIVGAGLSGAVFASIAARSGYKCLVIDKRSHIGGNCYDEIDEYGNLIHVYGPHYFRTNSQYIFDYLSEYTEWIHLKYEILSWTNGEYWNFPINLNTFEKILGRQSSSEEMEKILNEWKVPISNPANSEEIIISQVGYKLYEMFFKNYTIKQWGIEPKKLDKSVCGRIPIRTNRDNCYFNDKIQALPKNGYTAMIKNMLDHENITVELSSNKIKNPHDLKVYTGPVDEYFNYIYGKLPYRSLKFKREHHNMEYYQPAVQINYPNDYDYTRIIETKHITGIKTDVTTIVKEYPVSYEETKEPFYPIPTKNNIEQYTNYYNLTKFKNNIIFTGRLATYQYLNMDQVIGMSMKKAKDLGIKI